MLNEFIITNLNRFFNSENHSLIRLFRGQLSMIRSDFWEHNSLIRSNFECTIVWTMVWIWSDQRSFPSAKVWSETVSSALRAHMLFRAHFSMIRGYFGLGCSDQNFFRLARSDQRSLLDGTSIWVLGPRLN